MKPEAPLKVAAFLDTRPGHMKQTLGIIDALQELTPTEVIEIRLPHLPVLREIMNRFKYMFFPGALCSADLEGCDCMIGTGSRTHLPMLACKKLYPVPVVTCMTPSILLRDKFDLCFVPHHDRPAAGKNIVITNGPPNRARATGRNDPGKGLILIGGKDEKSHIWDSASIIREVSVLLQETNDIRWTISTSPRTPDETTNGLRKLAEEYPAVQFVPFSETGPGWIEQAYEQNKIVWVTADSMSMVFEALSAGCHVGLLPVRWKKPENKFQYCADNLGREGYIVTYEQWKSGKASWGRTEPLNEARRCAREILKRWWPDRLR